MPLQYLWSVTSCVLKSGRDKICFFDGVVSSKEAAMALAQRTHLELPDDCDLDHVNVERIMVDDPNPGFMYEGYIGIPNDNEELDWEEE